MGAFAALGDVTIVTAMSTLVGLELWVDQIGPQTKERAPPLFNLTGRSFDCVGFVRTIQISTDGACGRGEYAASNQAMRPVAAFFIS